ncbi:unnamed protein product [Prunus armeniaca]|uniref:ABC1 atypical kinase-like domain-containing protein n=1 Tax=Prunus armeniaca TaxID=36596 RepID=A0A6J5TS60_PRUAR|nr:unnamed protein product [Prunus armeniaca]
MGWGNIYKRRMKVCTVALMIYLDYKALQQREKWISKTKGATLWESAHERNAKRVLSLIIELEGLWVKLGQYLSTRADVLPEAYISLLKQLQDSLPPRPLEEVCRTIQKEFGKSMDELFLDFVKVPLATASIAQVHRATLLNGQEVVVKVQHEGIKTIILEDLKNAKSIVDWIAWAEPQFNFNPMIDEWCKESPKELDFNHEAENTRTVSKNLGCKTKCDDNTRADQVDVLIPEVIQSTEKVIISEFMDGIRLNDIESLEAFGVDKQKVIEEITRAYAHQIYIDGFFNGDLILVSLFPSAVLFQFVSQQVSKILCSTWFIALSPFCRKLSCEQGTSTSSCLLDFGLTKKLSSSFKKALAKMFLASAEGDHVALLSAFAEMGLKLRLDIPEQAMEITSVFFRSTTPANESHETMKSLADQRTKNMKVIQDKMQLNKKEVKRFNPVDAFPGDIVIFARVLNLLRGLSSTMNVRIVYQDIMRPFAESVLQGNINRGPMVNDQWVYDTPAHSDVEAKLRQLLVEMGNNNKILGVQVCAYKDGKVIIDTAAGVLGRYDPRPVQLDSLFPVFSVTKGITAGMLHWLADTGKLKLEENVANIWPEFGSNRKDHIKVHHVLNHTSGLHNASADIGRENPLLMADWEECLNRIAMSEPETEPGREQFYHYLSYGWICGGIIEHASGRKFKEILEEAFIHPLQIEGEMYIGIPPGVESRLATLTPDTEDLKKLSGLSSRTDLPSSFQPDNIIQLASVLPAVFNMLNIRRAIIPAANGHCSARALARYYAALVDGGFVPPPHSSSSKPALGSNPHIPKYPVKSSPKKQKGGRTKKVAAAFRCRTNKYEQTPQDPDQDIVSHSRNTSNDSDTGLTEVIVSPKKDNDGKIFSNPRIHDAFLGVGEYANLVKPDGNFGLGFKRYRSKDGSLSGFGHSGMGGSTGFVDIENRFAIAVTVNKMTFGAATGRIIQFVCSELNIPVPEDYSKFAESGSEVGKPLIN